MQEPDTTAAVARPAPLGALAALLALVLAAVALYWPSWTGLVARWGIGGGYPHGWLLLAATLWIIWDKAPAWLAGPTRPAPAAAILTLAASLGWLVAAIVSIQVGEQFFALAMVLTLPLALFGWRAGFQFAAVMGLMLFAVPVWDFVGPVLQAITTDVVGVCLEASRVPVLIQGDTVHIPAGRFRIVAGCSGLNYFVAAGAVAAIFGFLWLERWRHRFLLLACALALAILANWLRVYTVILAGELTDMQHFLVTVDHYWFGWVLFGIAMVPVYWLGGRLERAEARTRDTGTPAAGAGSGGPTVAAGGVLLAALAIPAAAWWLAGSAPTSVPGTADLLPRPVGWTLEPTDGQDWRPKYVGADMTALGRYQDGENTVDLGVVWYGRQTQGHELVFSGNHPADPDQWWIRHAGIRQHAGRDYGVAYLGRPDGETRVAWWWYEVAGDDTADATRAKLLQLKGFLAGRPEGAAFLVTARCARADCGDAMEAVGKFMDTVDRPVLGGAAGHREM